MLGLAVLTPALNFLLFGVDRLVFYVYPTRMARGAPGDFQAAGKQMVFMMFKMIAMGIAAGAVAAVAIPFAMILQSPLATFASAAVVLLCECLALVPLLTFAFDRFDPAETIVA